MRHATLTVCGLLSVAALLAARPRVTFDELVGRVEALEGRVKALEPQKLPEGRQAHRGVPMEIEPGRGELRVGMTEAQARSALSNLNMRVRRTVGSETAAGKVETWWLTDGPTDIDHLRLRNGTVIEVGRHRTD
jgi:hypothetical protein